MYILKSKGDIREPYKTPRFMGIGSSFSLILVNE